MDTRNKKPISVKNRIRALGAVILHSRRFATMESFCLLLIPIAIAIGVSTYQGENEFHQLQDKRKGETVGSLWIKTAPVNQAQDSQVKNTPPVVVEKIDEATIFSTKHTSHRSKIKS